MIKKLTLTTIGPRLEIALPRYGITGLPAKVDTGADSSAIWASKVREADGELSFVLFDVASPFYNGDIITAKHYTVSAIRNSFGQVEHRYKVTLQVVIAGRKINARFTLADRSANRFPVLIGRRTLQRKFLVDVAQTREVADLDVLVLSSKQISTAPPFFNDIEKKLDSKLHFTLATYDDLAFSLGGSSGNKIVLSDTSRDVASFDMIYFRSSALYADAATAVAHYARKRGVDFVDQAALHNPDASKLLQYVVLQDNDIAIPKSLFMSMGRLESSFEQIAGSLGLPFVLKDIHGRKGQNNFLVKDKQAFVKAYKEAENSHVRLIAQQFVPNDGDYRLVVLGSAVRLVIYRNSETSEKHTHNVSAGGEARLGGKNELPSSVCNESVKAAKLLGRDVAGVDMVQDKTDGSWYCLEVNDSPQITSGAFVTEKQAAFAEFVRKRLDGFSINGESV